MHSFITSDFEAIGTRWKIDIFQPLSEEKKKEIFNKIQQRIEIFDKSYSRFRPDSLVTEMSLQEGTYRLPQDADALFFLYQKLYKLTNGLLTPLVGQLLVNAGYDANYSLEQQKSLKKPEEWDEVMEYSCPYLTIKKPVLLDFGAAGKGYLIDIVAKIFEEYGIYAYCIDAGGDIFYRNTSDECLRVGLEYPEDTSKAIGVVSIINQSICGSAGNRRAWGKFHHIMNPATLTSVQHILATWVVADTTMLADALTTCLFLVSPKKVVQEFDFEYLILYADRSIEKSDKFPAELFVDRHKN